MAEIDYNREYVNNTGMRFKIVQELPRRPNCHDRPIRIKFIDSGYEKDTFLSNALKGSVKDDSLPKFDSTKMYLSTSGRPYHILTIIGSVGSHTTVKVRFDETGFENEVLLGNALKGFVGDHSILLYDPNKVYMSYNYGPFRVLRATNERTNQLLTLYEIEFLLTGYKAKYPIGRINLGNVEDPTLTGYRQKANELSQEYYELFLNRRLYGIWTNMIQRCSNPNQTSYANYGEIGVKVCKSWRLSYQNFLNDAPAIFQYSKFVKDFYNYELDKDYLQLQIPKGERVYSKETCAFLYYYDNANLRQIEQQMNGTTKNNYYGVSQTSENRFVMSIMCQNYERSIPFSSEIAAANAYNYWQEVWHTYDIVPLINQVPFMPVEEWTKYITYSKPLYSIIGGN